MRHILHIFLCTLLSWLMIVVGIWIYLSFVKESESAWFVTYHYTLTIFVIWLLFDQYVRRFEHYSAIGTMIIALGFLSLIEFIFWNYVYKGTVQLVNFTHFFVPMVLIGATIYLVGRQYKHEK